MSINFTIWVSYSNNYWENTHTKMVDSKKKILWNPRIIIYASNSIYTCEAHITSIETIELIRKSTLQSIVESSWSNKLSTINL